ncbi:MAG: MarR family transcriptional regulator [Acidobacteriota bacterium]
MRARSLPVRTWLQLVRVAQKVGRAAEGPLENSNLTSGQFILLAAVGAHEGALQDDFAHRLATTKGNVSQLLAKLEAKGYVRRVSAGRTKAVHLTQEGLELLDREIPAHDAFIEDCLAALTADDLEHLNDLLAKLDRSLD